MRASDQARTMSQWRMILCPVRLCLSIAFDTCFSSYARRESDKYQNIIRFIYLEQQQKTKRKYYYEHADVNVFDAARIQLLQPLLYTLRIVVVVVIFIIKFHYLIEKW